MEGLKHYARSMQIIAFALIMGIVFFGVITVGSLLRGDDRVGDAFLLSNVAGGFFVIQAALSFVVPAFVSRIRLKGMAKIFDSVKPDQLLDIHRVELILGFALLESAAFFGLIVTMQERQKWPLAIPAFCIALMLARFPTMTNVTHWIDWAGREIEKARAGVS